MHPRRGLAYAGPRTRHRARGWRAPKKLDSHPRKADGKLLASQMFRSERCALQQVGLRVGPPFTHSCSLLIHGQQAAISHAIDTAALRPSWDWPCGVPSRCAHEIGHTVSQPSAAASPYSVCPLYKASSTDLGLGNSYAGTADAEVRRYIYTFIYRCHTVKSSCVPRLERIVITVVYSCGDVTGVY